MKNTYTVLAAILQITALILFVGIFKSVGKVIAGSGDLPTFILMVVLALIFQGLSYSLSKRHPAESAKANEILTKPNKNYGIFALFFFIFTIIFFSTFILEQSIARLLLQAALITAGIACGIWLLRKK